MLIRQTLLYLPAQLLPAAAQFVSLAVWSHFASPQVIGTVTLLISIQEFLVLGLMGFWTTYSVRYASRPYDDEETRAFQRTSGPVVFTATALQMLIAGGLYVGLIDHQARWYVVLIVMIVVGGRAFNSYQAERARATGDIPLYSVQSICGPVIGMLIGVPLLIMLGSDELWIFLGYAVAQLAALLFGVVRDRTWVSLGPPDMAILRHALGYGGPLVIGAVFVWITQNVGRFGVSYQSGLGAAGVYSLGFGLGFRAASISAMAVTAAAFPLAVRYLNAADHEGAMRQLANNAVLLLAALCSTMTGLALLSADLLHIFIAPHMAGPAYPIMMWSILAGTAYCFRQHFLNQIFMLKAHTRPIAVVCGVEAAACVLATLVALRLWGATGAAATLAVLSVASMSSMLFMGVREGFRVPWLDFARVAAATAALAVAVLATPTAHNVVSLLIRIAAGGAAFGLVFGLLYLERVLGMFSRYLHRAET